jgi:hypothetical protein
MEYTDVLFIVALALAVIIAAAVVARRFAVRHSSDSASSDQRSGHTIIEPTAILVTVFETSNPALVAVAHSLLTSAGIQYAAGGDSTQHLLGGGQFGGLNLVAGPVQFLVREADAAEAARLLSALGVKRPYLTEMDR